ncbi:hypothetical protein SAY87_004569 [Trapa incisa]|uniref:Uncharacterized protein n=1 Tax=Trapa incisa TaxID=236973 RepID=A0AAN7JPW4_9MYRT|nr:hypothetical protein SAY87_004569 [Trapa incisa]
MATVINDHNIGAGDLYCSTVPTNTSQKYRQGFVFAVLTRHPSERTEAFSVRNLTFHLHGYFERNGNDPRHFPSSPVAVSGVPSHGLRCLTVIIPPDRCKATVPEWGSIPFYSPNQSPELLRYGRNFVPVPNLGYLVGGLMFSFRCVAVIARLPPRCEVLQN